MTLLLLLAACKHTSGEVTHEDGPPAAVDALEVTSVNAAVGADGRLDVEFDVDAGTTSFALEGRLPDDDHNLSLVELRTPSNGLAIDCSLWVPNGDHALTDACWAYTPMMLDFPIVPGQTLAAGTWSAVFATDGAEGDEATMTLVQRGADGDGTTDVYAQLLIAEGLPKRFRDQAVYDEAIQHWVDVWGSHDIALHPRWGTVDIGAGTSDAMEWRPTADGAGAIAEMTIVFTKLKTPGTLGYVTAAPGPVLPGKDGILVVDVPAHAGADGRLDTPEAETLGETIAHEALHYQGLYHPAQGDAAPDQWDAIDDTLECTDWETCDTELGSNLMYWSTVFTDSGDRVPQIDLTADQKHIARNWAGSL